MPQANFETMSAAAAQALDLCRALISRPSVTPADAGALDVAQKALADAGFETHRVVFSEPGWPDTDNLYARIGASAPCLVFAGHTDVVPPGDAAKWRFDPFSGEIADDMVWGRGAADMKGAVAAAIAASVDHVKRQGMATGSIAFLLTGDEEGPAVNGTTKLLRWASERGERFDHCLLGEPTNPEALGDMIKIGRRGSLTGRLTVRGKQGHVGYPALADNPAHHIVRLLAALRAEPLDSGTSHFDASNLEVVTIDIGNPAANVIPGEARATFNIRFNDLWTPETLAAEIQRRATVAGEAASYEIVFDPTNAIAFLTEPGLFVDLVAGAVEARTGRRPALSTTGGTSDARFIKDHCPVVEFGLVGKTMHAVDERIAISDLAALTDIYVHVLAAYFDRGGEAWRG